MKKSEKKDSRTLLSIDPGINHVAVVLIDVETGDLLKHTLIANDYTGPNRMDKMIVAAELTSKNSVVKDMVRASDDILVELTPMASANAARLAYIAGYIGGYTRKPTQIINAQTWKRGRSKEKAWDEILGKLKPKISTRGMLTLNKYPDRLRHNVLDAWAMGVYHAMER